MAEFEKQPESVEEIVRRVLGEQKSHAHRQFGSWCSRANLIDLAMFSPQADATIHVVNPVSGFLNPVLTTTNARILSIWADVNWAGVQPTPLQVVCVIDGQTITFGQVNPVTATDYFACSTPQNLPTAQIFHTNIDTVQVGMIPFLLEGKSVVVGARITLGAPSDLYCRVKYSRRL